MKYVPIVPIVFVVISLICLWLGILLHKDSITTAIVVQTYTLNAITFAILSLVEVVDRVLSKLSDKP